MNRFPKVSQNALSLRTLFFRRVVGVESENANEYLWQMDVLAVFAGCLLPLAFAPFNYYLLAIIAPALLMCSWLKTTPWRAFWRGWLFGLGMFGVGVSWFYVSIHVYGETSVPLAVLFMSVFIAFLALFPAIQGYCLVRFASRYKNAEILLAFPAIWVIFEWIRSWIFGGFPWLYLCYSQIESPLRGYIPILGCYGTSFVVVMLSALMLYCYSCWKEKNKPMIPLLAFILIIITAQFLSLIHWVQPTDKTVKVAMIQGNIAQNIKWSEEYIASTIKLYTQLTQKNWDNDIIVWPETAITMPLPQAQPFITQLDKEAKAHNAAVMIGIPVESAEMFHYYNALIIAGNGKGQYYKRHIVPFGEYLPLEGLLSGAMEFLDLPVSTMLAGPDSQPLLSINSILLAPFICNEIAYSEELFAVLPQAQLLVVMSNDAWFGDSFAPMQHLQMAQFRALQAGRPLLFSASTGITAAVDAQGRIVAQAPQFKETVLTTSVQLVQGRTPWSYLGIWPFVGGCFVLLGLVIGWCYKGSIEKV